MSIAEADMMPGIDLLPDPIFPPLLTGYAVPGDQSAAAVALARADSGEAGGGDLFWSRHTDRLDCALVLEPELDAAGTLAMIPLAMVALADSLGAIGPPNLGITFVWPNITLANGAVVGEIDIRFPAATKPADEPFYACLSIALDIAWQEGARDEPGRELNRTVLYEEGCGDLDRTMILESWARHFLTWLDTWNQDGFRPVHESWLFRAHDRDGDCSLALQGETIEGSFLGLDEAGGIMIKTQDKTRLVSLAGYWFETRSTGKS